MKHLILAAFVAALCQPAWGAAKSELTFPSYDWHVTPSDRGNGGCDLVKVGDRDRTLIVHADADKPFDVSVLFGRDRCPHRYRWRACYRPAVGTEPSATGISSCA